MRRRQTPEDSLGCPALPRRTAGTAPRSPRTCRAETRSASPVGSCPCTACPLPRRSPGKTSRRPPPGSRSTADCPSARKLPPSTRSSPQAGHLRRRRHRPRCRRPRHPSRRCRRTPTARRRSRPAPGRLPPPCASRQGYQLRRGGASTAMMWRRGGRASVVTQLGDRLRRRSYLPVRGRRNAVTNLRAASAMLASVARGTRKPS